MKIEAQEIVGSLSRKEGKILFTYNGHKGEITLTLPTAVQWETIKMWLEVLEDTNRAQSLKAWRAWFAPKTEGNEPKDADDKTKPPQWTSCKDAAKHYRVSMSTVHHWGAAGRIRRRRSGKTHSRTRGPIWQYDVSHNYTSVPPKDTYSVQH